MQRLIPTLALMLLAVGAQAAPKPCEELKEEIEVKIQAAGVPSYTLEIVANDEVTDQSMVVGSCDGGSKKIIYQKNG
jgi:translation initiation factor 2 alpha subunit (eIF-2alpha)